MINEIETEPEYLEVTNSLEKILLEVTERGGFDFLSELEKEKLVHLGSLAKKYEDDVLRLMPLLA